MKKKQNKFGKMPSGPFNIVIFVVLLIACIFMLSKVADTVKDKGEIPYSEYLNLIEQDKVKKVEILGSFVNGVTKSDKPFETNVAEYSGHWDLLRKHNVEFMIINQSNQFNMWYLLLLIMLVAALALMWYFSNQIVILMVVVVEIFLPWVKVKLKCFYRLLLKKIFLLLQELKKQKKN